MKVSSCLRALEFYRDAGVVSIKAVRKDTLQIVTYKAMEGPVEVYITPQEAIDGLLRIHEALEKLNRRNNEQANTPGSYSYP